MKGKRLRRVVCSLSALVLAGFLGFGQSAEAAFDSPYVKAETVFDDTGMHQHWTIEEDFPYEIQSPADFYERGKLVNPPPYWYEQGTTVTTGKTSTLRTPGQGEHYYTWKRMGEVPIGKWVVNWQPGRCIHRYYEPVWQTLSTGLHPDVNGGICGKAYYSGWFAYCADCGQQLETAHVYASKEAISTIKVMDMDYGYYYLCPNPDCRHLENTGEPMEHECKNVSPVMYRVKYEKNTDDRVDGLMPESYHMWNNATTHDGVAVDPVTRLSKIGYVRKNYSLAGWNTKPDGSGTFYGDEAEIYNLCEYDYFEWEKKGDEEKGTVHLYAQWVPTSSYLHIDPNGGTYKGNSGITEIHEGAGKTYTADPGDVAGTSHYNVNYNTNGGNALSSTPIPEVFREWGKNADFKGKLTDGKTYKFPYVNDHIDTLTAKYEYGSIILPTPIHPSGYGFGGWYEDPGCTTNLVGFGGDSYTPGEDITGDVTLYAKWVNLVLWSKENYTDNEKKGAADHRWQENDSYIKAFNLYRAGETILGSLVPGAFTKVYDTDVAAIPPVTKEFAFSTSTPVQNYTVPTSGFYSFEAYGAQGGSYGSYEGGKGGKVTASFYLTKGEVLRITVGGQNGTGGGGSKVSGGFANGGGATTIEATKNGTTRTLLVAGGGGGASAYNPGGIGGPQDAVGLRSDNVSGGQSGVAAGGGGYRGGLAGTVTVHTCSLAECYTKHTHTPDCYETRAHTCDFNIYTTNASKFAVDSRNGARFPLKGNINVPTSTCATYGHAGWMIFCKGDEPGCGGIGGWACPSGRGDGKCHGPYYYAHEDPSRGWDCCVYWCDFKNNGSQDRVLKCTKSEEYTKICPYTDGQILDTAMSYGGSSYVDSSRTSVSFENGNRSGNGYVKMVSTALGMNDGLEKKGVAAPDLAAPDGIDENTVTVSSLGSVRTEVAFERPLDNGTPYWWKVESINVLTGGKICDSNITKTTLTTGVSKYLYLYNTTASQTITDAAGCSVFNAVPGAEKDSIRLDLVYDVQYLHIAPVDVAGNIGPTIDIELNKEAQDWPIITTPVTISSSINGRDYGSVYSNGANHYVRADGTTPFKLSFESYIDGNARLDYQIDTQIFSVEKNTAGTAQRFITGVPKCTALTDTTPVAAAGMSRVTQGSSLLKTGSYLFAQRKNLCNRNVFAQSFTIPASLNGQMLVITPSASAEAPHTEAGYIESVWADDVNHAIQIIPDGIGPVITVNQALDDSTVVNKDTVVNTTVELTSTDALSGVKTFYARIRNQDNGMSTIISAGADGKVTFVIDATDALYAGDLLIEAVSIDNVGNSTVAKYGVEELDVQASIEHAGYNPNKRTTFMGGELANLTIESRGYVDRVTVEVPDALKPGNEGVTVEFNYSDPKRYRELETCLFTIPYTAPEGNYTFTVTAFKDGNMVSRKPVLVTIIRGNFSGDVHVRVK